MRMVARLGKGEEGIICCVCVLGWDGREWDVQPEEEEKEEEEGMNEESKEMKTRGSACRGGTSTTLCRCKHREAVCCLPLSVHGHHATLARVMLYFQVPFFYVRACTHVRMQGGCVPPLFSA